MIFNNCVGLELQKMSGIQFDYMEGDVSIKEAMRVQETALIEIVDMLDISREQRETMHRLMRLLPETLQLNIAKSDDRRYNELEERYIQAWEKLEAYTSVYGDLSDKQYNDSWSIPTGYVVGGV